MIGRPVRRKAVASVVVEPTFGPSRSVTAAPPIGVEAVGRFRHGPRQRERTGRGAGPVGVAPPPHETADNDATTNNSRRIDIPSQAQSHSDHRPSRIHEQRGEREILTEEVVRRDVFSGLLVEHVQNVDQNLDPRSALLQQHSRGSQVEQRLGSQPTGSSWLEQDALIALRQRDLRRRRPGLAGTPARIGIPGPARRRRRTGDPGRRRSPAPRAPRRPGRGRAQANRSPLPRARPLRTLLGRVDLDRAHAELRLSDASTQLDDHRGRRGHLCARARRDGLAHCS